MRVLIACEFSGVVRQAFRERGHEAYSCDLLPSEDQSEYHYQDDVLEVLNEYRWDLMIAHPPCTYLSVSGLHWTTKNPQRASQTEAALWFVQYLMDVQINQICIENPVSCISSRIRKPDQIVQPYQYGEDASKKTCLWLKNLPPLVPTQYVEPRWVDGKPRWANQTDSGQNKLGPSPTRAAERSRTYVGIAKAMASQWG